MVEEKQLVWTGGVLTAVLCCAEEAATDSWKEKEGEEDVQIVARLQHMRGRPAFCHTGGVRACMHVCCCFAPSVSSVAAELCVEATPLQ